LALRLWVPFREIAIDSRAAFVANALMSFWTRIFGQRLPTMVWEMPVNYVVPEVVDLPAVQRCVHLIASDISRCPITITDDDGNPVEDDTLEELFCGVAFADTLTGADLMRWMVAETLTRGNAFAFIILDGNGDPIGIRPVNTLNVTLRQQPDGTLEWLYQGTPFDYSMVLHWKALPTPGNPYWGTSPLSASSTTLEALANLEGAYNAIAKTGGIGKLQFSHPGAIQPSVRTAMRDAFVAQHGTSSSTGTPIFVGEGMEIKQVSPTIMADLAKARADGVREVASIFGVPAAYLHGSDARSQPEIAQMYVSTCLEAWSRSWMAEITAKLAMPGIKVGIDFVPVMQGDFRTAGNAYAQLMQLGALTGNDVRYRLGFHPLPGLDEAKPVISGVSQQPIAANDPQSEDPPTKEDSENA